MPRRSQGFLRAKCEVTHKKHQANRFALGRRLAHRLFVPLGRQAKKLKMDAVREVEGEKA